MKLTLSTVVLALAVTQVQAYPPIPVKACTQLVLITPADTSCIDFAAKFGITFEQLRAMNQRLSPVCNNLDVGSYICVSITGPNLGTLTSIPPYPGQTGVPTTVSAPLPTITSGSVLPPPKGTTTSTAPITTPSATSGAPAASTTSTAPKTTTTPSAASSSKASLVLGAAGVLLSVAYML
ncbi:hypothetical protein CPB97_006425 [Podila verticillata]|nr:hypothetical protein CPB97_006425 [Podila verticillata]